ncbi:cysteine protease [Candidatus Pacearchaeota archaeon]|jgi:C1A family cysteine protease|nr:cysteine protease [bacterium]MCK9597148.1 cysteine protease [Candidatus Pacearchaeota archaeon]
MEFSFTGWLVDYPDHRDYSLKSQSVGDLLDRLKINDNNMELSNSVDLRKYCSPIEDQGNIGSCTANAAASIVEYYERKAFGKHTDVSRLFLYKVTRNLLKWSGDTGAFLRTTMAALRLYGAPPESYWPYDVSKYDIEPTSFVYSLAQNFKATKYIKIDQHNLSKENILTNIKKCLVAGLPLMFGFTTYDSLVQSRYTGKIPFPGSNETAKGGHAIGSYGFDDNIQIKHDFTGEITTGAFLIRNSWGPKWGFDGGYGWLPYQYLLKGLAVDWWTLISSDWVDTGEFGL